MQSALFLLLTTLTAVVLSAHQRIPCCHDTNTRPVILAMEALLSQPQRSACFLSIITSGMDGTYFNYKNLRTLHKSWPIGFFEVAENIQHSNDSQSWFTFVVNQISEVQQAFRCMTMVVASDNPSFLENVAESALAGHSLPWSTKLLVITHLPLGKLRGLQTLLSSTNSMLLILHHKNNDNSGTVYLQDPFPEVGSQPRRVAAWSQRRGLISSSVLFPPKYLVFRSAPSLVATIELMPHHKIYFTEDPTLPGGRRVHYVGAINYMNQYLAAGMNFTYRYVVSPERTFGNQRADGSWTGMLGMLMRKEADFGGTPFILNPIRASAAGHTWTLWTDTMRIVSSLGIREVDEWGFLFPLAPLVWLCVLGAFVAVVSAVLLICCMLAELERSRWESGFLRVLYIILQQSTKLVGQNMWWSERVVVGVWMLTTLVLTKSYSGNLMSLLAVRHIPQPFQSLRDVLDDPSVAMIWQKKSANEHYIRSVQSGIYREVADLELNNRLLFHTQSQFPDSLHSLVREGRHVLVDVDVNLRNLMAGEFSDTGECSFYVAREKLLPFSVAILSQKTNPLIQGFNKRVIALTESGLFKYWMENVPNSTQCVNQPKKILETSFLSIANIWGMMVVLAGGEVIAGVVLIMEMFHGYCASHMKMEF